MKTHPKIGLGVPQILLPKDGVDLTKWAVIACDQFTANRPYWEAAHKLVGSAPSTLNLIFPEVYLNDSDKEERIRRIRETMDSYLTNDILTEKEAFVYLERTVGHTTRRGLMVCIDLEQYDYNKGSTSLIRATEGTILDRIPPRVKIRKGAAIELPHIMVLIDDPADRVFGPLAQAKGAMKKVYDFELMADSGHLTGYFVENAALEKGVVAALESLADPKSFAQKYELPNETPVLLFAMGDGNHSLATAKAIWEETKATAANVATVLDSPLRYALVELVNLHDESLVFAAIHRVLFEVTSGRDPVAEMQRAWGKNCTVRSQSSPAQMVECVDSAPAGIHRIGIIDASSVNVIEVGNPASNLAVGTLQGFLDDFMKSKGAKEIDYIHDTKPVVELGSKLGNMGFYLPALKKTELFRSVILDGALPRKTFSMGESKDKRFYLEARLLSRSR